MWAKGKKHAATKEQTGQVSPPETGKAFAGVVKSTSWKSKKTLVIAGILGFIVLAAAIYVARESLFSGKSEAPLTVSLDYKKDITGQVETLDEAETAELAAAKVDPAKDINLAYAVALALGKQDKTQDALALFKKITATGKTTYKMHESYGLAAMVSENMVLAKEQLNLAITKLGQDNSVPNADKTLIERRLKSKLSGLEDTAS